MARIIIDVPDEGLEPIAAWVNEALKDSHFCTGLGGNPQYSIGAVEKANRGATIIMRRVGEEVKQ